MTIEDEIKWAKEAKKGLDGVLRQMSILGTQSAIWAAAEATPPVMDDLSGVNTRTGNLKARWAKDTTLDPERTSEGYVTVLRNNAPYASFVNDGHRMDKHYVPGLHINPYSGYLEYDPNIPGGITVGTKTTYVPGLYMAEKGEDAFSAFVEGEGTKMLDDFLEKGP